MNSILILVICGLIPCGFLASYLSNAGGLTPSPDGEGWGEENPKHWLLVWGKFLLKGVATATDVLMSVFAPTGEVLFFACPKKSTQKKRHPDAAFILRSSLLAGVAERGFLPLRQRDASLHRPYGLIPPKAPVLGAAYGTSPCLLHRWKPCINYLSAHRPNNQMQKVGWAECNEAQRIDFIGLCYANPTYIFGFFNVFQQIGVSSSWLKKNNKHNFVHPLEVDEVLFPYAAPNTGAFGETNRQDNRFACIAPAGRGTGTYRVNSPIGERQGGRSSAEGLGSPFCRPSPKASARRIQAASGSPFFWILSFGDAKESISPVGARTDIKKNVAIATQYSILATSYLSLLTALLIPIFSYAGRVAGGDAVTLQGRTVSQGVAQ